MGWFLGFTVKRVAHVGALTGTQPHPPPYPLGNTPPYNKSVIVLCTFYGHLIEFMVLTLKIDMQVDNAVEV